MKFIHRLREGDMIQNGISWQWWHSKSYFLTMGIHLRIGKFMFRIQGRWTFIEYDPFKELK